jgi:hypothetical protein
MMHSGEMAEQLLHVALTFLQSPLQALLLAAWEDSGPWVLCDAAGVMLGNLGGALQGFMSCPRATRSWEDSCQRLAQMVLL